MNTPLVQKSIAQPQRTTKPAKDIVLSVFCWIISLGIWGIIIYLSIYIYFLREKTENLAKIKPFGYTLLVLYFIYLLLEFCSPTCRYLIHKRSNEGIKAKMGDLFKSRPEIKFYAECYHYETRRYTVTDNEGNKEERTETVKVVTHRETEYFHYYSVRDISGLLNLNCDKAQIRRKCYIKLELKEEINFADSISISDYLSQMERFKDRNRNRDEYMDFSETRRLPGMTHHNLIRFGEYDPCTVNFFWYFLFTIFTLSQIYKWHVNSFCIYQNYKIRKIMSTRYNLNSKQFDHKYAAFNPQINLITLKIDYEPEYYNYLDTSATINLPTQEELEMAKKYENQVPKYEIYSENCGNIYRCGTVKDIPDFQCYSDAPAITIPRTDNNQINSTSNMPSGFKNPETNNIIMPPQNELIDQGYNSTEQGAGIVVNGEGISSGGGIYGDNINKNI